MPGNKFQGISGVKQDLKEKSPKRKKVLKNPGP